MSEKYFNKENTLRMAIRKNMEKVFEERKKVITENPAQSPFGKEIAQPAFKFHLNQYNPNLPLGDGTRNVLNSRGSEFIKSKHMDDLESVTTKANGSVIGGLCADVGLCNLETIKENSRHKLIHENMVRLKSNTKSRRSTVLPIHRHEKDILREIENNQTLVIQGSTGCGKSTQVPQFILDDAFIKEEPVNIVVTQPRRIAAISVAMHVASERGWEIGSYVGYQVGLDRKCSNETVITFVTTGVLLEQLIHNQTLTDYTHIILDEVHERDVDMDLLLSVVKDLLMHDTRTKVILMSATVAADKFSCYFSKQIDPRTLEPLPGSIFRIEGKMFPVEEFFLDDLPKLGICQDSPYSYDVCIQPRLTAELKEIIYQLLMYITYIEINESKCSDINQLDMGSVLVFLPGLSDITELNEYLLLGCKRENCVNPRKRNYFTNSGQSAAIFPLRIDPKSCIRKILEDEKLQKIYQDTFYLLALHSSIGISEQKRAFDNAQVGRRKIILSTNIAESSITVKDIKYVIDLCMIKRLRYDRETHFSSLKAEWASKSSCKQRAGRAGRVRNGVVFRLISQHVYNQLDEFCPPEILTGPLTQVILRIKEFNREPRALLQRALDCPSLEDIGYTFLTLKEAGALSIKRNEITHTTTKENGDKVQVTQVVMPIEDHWQGELTFIGRLISALPMDLHMGKLIALGYAFDVLEETIIIAACLTVSRSVFSQPFFSGKVKDSKFSKAPNQIRILDAFEKKLRLSESKYSDLLTMLNAFKLWYQRTKTGAFRTREDEYKWCSSLYLDPQALHEVEVLTDEIKRRLKDKFNITVLEFSKLDKKDGEEDLFFEPSSNHISNINSVVISKTFRVILLQITIAGAFYPNYFLRTHNPFIEDDAMRTFDGLDPFQCVEIGNLPMDEGCLYRDTIAEHFKSFCMKFSSDKPVVICRNTKGIIKFPVNNGSFINESLNSTNSNAFNLSVLLALKMGQFSSLKPRIEVFELSNDEKSTLKAIMEKESIKNNQILPLNYKYTAGNKHFIGFPSVECNFVRVYVSYASECGSFYGIYEEEKDNEQNLLQEIKDYTANMKNLVKSRVFEVNDFCLAPYEGDYYRAEIISKNNQNFTVFFVDYGNYLNLNSSQLFDLPDFLLNMCPLMAVKFVLSEIKPYTAYHPDNKWSPQDKDVFLNYINCYNNTPIGCKIYSVVDNTVRVRVQMVDHQDKILNEELMVMGIAEYTEESYTSRQDNLARTKYNNKRHIDLFGPVNGDSKIVFMKNLLNNESGVDNASDNGKNSMVKNDGLESLRKRIEIRNMSQMVTLSSPSHPYIMKFHGLTESCKRPVTLATDSVNSIIIEPEPQNHLHRMLVANCVQSSGGGEQGNDLLLRNTTLMPSIPGLPFLMVLIFTPYAELISDKFQTRYIGAKCGLGIDSEGRPLHPANDMEMRTDVRFDSGDMKNVNGIRSLLNISLGSTGHTQDAMDRYQSGIKKFIASLFLKHNRDLVNNNNVGEYRVKSDISLLQNETFSNVRQINKIFIPHIFIDGVARRLDWVRNPILGDPRTERAKAEWLPRYMAAAEENLKDLMQTHRPMSRVKLSRDVMPEVKICELCTQNSDYMTEKSRLGVPLYTEADLEDHVENHLHKQNVLQMRNLLNI